MNYPVLAARSTGTIGRPPENGARQTRRAIVRVARGGERGRETRDDRWQYTRTNTTGCVPRSVVSRLEKSRLSAAFPPRDSAGREATFGGAPSPRSRARKAGATEERAVLRGFLLLPFISGPLCPACASRRRNESCAPGRPFVRRVPVVRVAFNIRVHSATRNDTVGSMGIRRNSATGRPSEIAGRSSFFCEELPRRRWRRNWVNAGETVGCPWLDADSSGINPVADRALLFSCERPLNATSIGVSVRFLDVHNWDVLGCPEG